MKCLFVGFGTIAQKHYAALYSLEPKCKFYALRSSLTPRFINPNVIDVYSWDDIPKKIDFAIISTPTRYHLDSLIKLVDLGINIFIEKPISDDLLGLEELSNLIKRKNIKTYVACNLRFLPVLNYFNEKVLPTITRINEVTIYCGSYLPSWRDNQDYYSFYSAHESQGGGVHLDLFHELDYACWLFGMPKKSKRFLTNNSSLNITSKDFANYLLLYDYYSVVITLNYFRRDAKREIEVVTDEETFKIDLLKNIISNSQGIIMYEDKMSGILETYKYQMKYFIDFINDAESEINSIEYSSKILKICLSNET
jgi:predicted dehydrogenase